MPKRLNINYNWGLLVLSFIKSSVPINMYYISFFPGL